MKFSRPASLRPLVSLDVFFALNSREGARENRELRTRLEKFGTH